MHTYSQKLNFIISVLGEERSLRIQRPAFLTAAQSLDPLCLLAVKEKKEKCFCFVSALPASLCQGEEQVILYIGYLCKNNLLPPPSSCL